MKVGVVYPQTELKGDPQAVPDIGLATEELGYDHFLMYDHVVGAVHEGRAPPRDASLSLSAPAPQTGPRIFGYFCTLSLTH